MNTIHHANRAEWPADVLIICGGDATREGWVCYFRDGRAPTFHTTAPEQIEAEMIAAGLSFARCECAPAASIVRENEDGSWTAEPMPRPRTEG